MHGDHGETERVSEAVNEVGTAVMDAAFTVHRHFGPGLLEAVYEHCLAEELAQAGLTVERQVAIHTAQVLTYLRFSQLRLGYLINFNSVMLKDGFRRLVM